MSKIAITDYITNPNIEREILGELLGTELAEDTEILLVWHEQINEKYIKKLPKLKAVQCYGVGYDNLDLEMLKKKDIIACNNPDYGVDEVSDTTVAMIMNIVRGVLLYNHNAKTYFNSWQENINNKIKRNCEITIGIVGAGRIGGSVILKCNALKFKTIFYDKYKEQGYEKMLSSKRSDSLEEVLKNADIISLHVPLSKETKGMVNRSFLKQMKKGASIVNTARGGLFESLDVLYDALKNNSLSQLAVDVLPEEPPQKGKLINAWRNAEEWINGRLVINPHTSYYSQQALTELRTKAALNALRIYNGQVPFNRLY